MPARTTTIRALMIAVLGVAVLMGAAVATEAAAPRDFPAVFRVALGEGVVAAALAVLVRVMIGRDVP